MASLPILIASILNPILTPYLVMQGEGRLNGIGDHAGAEAPARSPIPYVLDWGVA